MRALAYIDFEEELGFAQRKKARGIGHLASRSVGLFT